jgi:hypothetical protein
LEVSIPLRMPSLEACVVCNPGFKAAVYEREGAGEEKVNMG